MRKKEGKAYEKEPGETTIIGNPGDTGDVILQTPQKGIPLIKGVGLRTLHEGLPSFSIKPTNNPKLFIIIQKPGKSIATIRKPYKKYYLDIEKQEIVFTAKAGISYKEKPKLKGRGWAIPILSFDKDSYPLFKIKPKVENIRVTKKENGYKLITGAITDLSVNQKEVGAFEKSFNFECEENWSMGYNCSLSPKLKLVEVKEDLSKVKFKFKIENYTGEGENIRFSRKFSIQFELEAIKIFKEGNLIGILEEF